MIDTALVFNAKEAKPPSSTATWLERMCKSACCELCIDAECVMILCTEYVKKLFYHSKLASMNLHGSIGGQ